MTAPLTPTDCDLTDFAYMPLDVARLRQSELTSDETPEACWAAVLLWCASWHEVPAASIPDNDQWQAKQCGYVARGKIDKAWESVRAGALRGFVKCSDGRLYHTVVAEKARESWESKQRHAYGKMAERVRKANKHRAENSLPPIDSPTFEQWLSAGRVDPLPPEAPHAKHGIPPETQPPSAGIPPEKTLKGEGEGEGEGNIGIQEADASLSPAMPATTDLLGAEHSKAIPPCPVRQLVALFVQTVPELPHPRIELWKDSAGAASMRQRWKWLLSADAVREDGSRYATSAAEAVEWFGRYFERVAASDFLTGRHGGWSGCDLAWLMKAENFMKVVQGNYENKERARA